MHYFLTNNQLYNYLFGVTQLRDCGGELGVIKFQVDLGNFLYSVDKSWGKVKNCNFHKWMLNLYCAHVCYTLYDIR